MALTLTAREHEMLSAVIKEMNNLPPVDFAKVADRTGHKYSRNARSAFKKIWDKLESANGNAADVTEFSTDGDTSTPVKSKAKSTRKKGVGKQAGPRKAGTNGPKPKRKTKKEKDDQEAAMALALAAAEYENIADADDDEDSIAGSGLENENDASFVKEEDEEDKQSEGGGRPNEQQENEELGALLMGIPIEDFRRMTRENGDASLVKMEEENEEEEEEEQNQQQNDDEELGAHLMGIPLKEFRKMARETRWFTAAPTPEPAHDSDGEIV